MSIENAWSTFRTWRRSRPFWGGLFLVLSALEMFLSANLTLTKLEVHIGQEGYLSYLLPAILILCGVLTWITPAQRFFYGILGLLTALYSFVGLNLGGFLLGMLLGIVGGALVVSWGAPRVEKDVATEAAAETDTDPAPDSEGDSLADGPDREPHEDLQTTAILPGFAADHDADPHHDGDARHDGHHDNDASHDGDAGHDGDGHHDDADEPEPRPPSNRGVHRKLLVITLVPLALTATLLLASSHTPARADNDCPKGLPSRSATATSAGTESAGTESAGTDSPAKEKAAAKSPAKAATSRQKTPAGTGASGSATPTPTSTATASEGTGNPIVDGWNDFVDGVGKVLGIGDDESPSPSASSDPSPTATPDPQPTPSATPAPSSSPSVTPSATGGPEGSASPSPTPTLSDVPCLGPRVFKDAKPAGEPTVSIKGGLLEGKSLNMYDPTYDGTVDLQTSTGPLKVLKFSMSRAVTEPFSLTIDEPGGHRTVITTNQLTIKDDVKFYTPNFQGKLFGVIPVTFTPASPPPLTLPWLYFSDVRINLALVTCETLTAKPLLDLKEVS